MKKSATILPLLTALLLVALPAQAQEAMQHAPTYPLIFGFETLADDTTFFPFGYGSTPDDDTDRPYIQFQELRTGNPFGISPMEGDGALLIDWQLFTNQSWGGSMGIIHELPDTTERYYDFSDFTHINLGYNVLVPADPAAEFRIKLHDASLGLGSSSSSETEDWYSTNMTLFQDQPGWKTFSMPLEDLGLPGQQILQNGFSRPGCDPAGDPEAQSGCWSGLLGNAQLDLDKISSFTIEFVGPQYGAAFDSSTAGTIVFDKLYVSGVRWDLLHAFDAAPGGWVNGSGSATRTVVADTVEGSGALLFDYNVVGSESWGGSADVQVIPDGGYPNLTARTHVSIFYKVTEPVTGGDAGLVFKIQENGEEYHYTVPGNILADTSGTWKRLLLPIRDFAMPSWWGNRGDEQLDRSAIAEMQFQVLVGNGANVSGAIMFDRMTSYGSQQTDFEGPAPVSSFDITPADRVNLVSWTDVDGEEGERYSVYYSLNPITDLEAAGVYSVALDVAEGTEVLQHPIFSPIEDREVTYYYAIVAEDQVGNMGEMSVTGAVSNTAEGIPTVHLGSPANFAADGDLSDWSGIDPIHISPDGDVGHVAANFFVTNSADLSADTYIAAGNDGLYIAFDVTDDTYVPVPDPVNGEEAGERWLYDGAELYIGLYNEQRPRHPAFQSTGAERDFKFYFYKQEAFSDQITEQWPVEGDNYAWTRTSDGYHAELFLPYSVLFPENQVFVPENGMRIPLDVVFMDNDTQNSSSREGILAFSDKNNDNSWQTPMNWAYTWIGDQMTTVDVEDEASDLPGAFALGQNYPNPFNPATMISYELPVASRVTLKVFNVLGQEVATLVDGTQSAGVHEVRFDARDLSSGFYIYRMEAGDHVSSRKMLLVR